MGGSTAARRKPSVVRIFKEMGDVCISGSSPQYSGPRWIWVFGMNKLKRAIDSPDLTELISP